MSWSKPGNFDHGTITTNTSVSGQYLADFYGNQANSKEPWLGGITLKADPFTNFVAKDINNPMLNGEPIKVQTLGASGMLADLLNDKFLAGQVHELANSSGALMSGGDLTYKGDKTGNDPDPDTGYQLDKCLVKELNK